MTTTLIYNAVAVGATDATGASPVKTTLNALTTVISLSCKFTNGNARGDGGKRPILYAATSPFDMTTAQAIDWLRSVDADQIECEVHCSPNSSKITSSEVLPVKGGYLYTWLDYAKLDAAGAIDVNLVEY
jgi:hypothetical protein